jgi:hypothetical protein
MKNVDKLKISPEKVLKNDELSKLRGGGTCICYYSDGTTAITGAAQNAGDCSAMCVYGGGYSYFPGSNET